MPHRIGGLQIKIALVELADLRIGQMTSVVDKLLKNELPCLPQGGAAAYALAAILPRKLVSAPLHVDL
ncbi:hypothetical protein VDQ16_21275 [Xanthomonas campestris pv. campestris]|nr:hypothetical protein [Xanthomonas campestris pv. campestris]MEB1324810.1 hypothetical protein [Xanthomonas campestris pv. campestris]MEB1358288.1 hypothetical protein [Xanthomonas campestris pv. campestris]MEB1424271.1 hypothetical protein [Xanthomonas campestris pv. campestris]MEB1449236.1 hypothetical protein [Xanthomonas campestris pv. campestris]